MLEEGLLDLPKPPGGSEFAGDRSVRPAHHVVAADRLAEQPRRFDHGRCRHAVHHGQGPRRHASEPYRALDPIPIACEIVQALQTMITRRIDVFDPAVVTVGKIVAGTVNNIIPRPPRSKEPSALSASELGARFTTESVASPRGCRCSTTPRSTRGLADGYPVNDEGAADVDYVGLANALVGADKTLRLPNPIMGAEDFSYVLQQVPGALVFLGGTRPPIAAR